MYRGMVNYTIAYGSWSWAPMNMWTEKTKKIKKINSQKPVFVCNTKEEAKKKPHIDRKRNEWENTKYVCTLPSKVKVKFLKHVNESTSNNVKRKKNKR